MNMSEWLEGLRKVDLSELDLNNQIGRAHV